MSRPEAAVRRGGRPTPPDGVSGCPSSPSPWSPSPSGYLALFQYGVVDTVWEPFFGDGSATVLKSTLSRILPMSDAALGAAGYLADTVTGVLFGVHRWRTHPWIVVMFGVAVGLRWFNLPVGGWLVVAPWCSAPPPTR